ncbi:FecR family protein [Devosia sp.]|uniref:FecR family protein n=1 Tax=Devosia sp. TaxID=1871048 RepID=UPI003A90AF41
MNRTRSCVLAMAAMMLMPGLAEAASGTALGVDPDATAERSSGNTVLTVGADIFIGDRVVTGADGLVQIKFEDKTELVVGPDSALVIEDYLLRDDGSAGKLAVDALSGTFRFVTGAAPKDRYAITTPSGTIGVRGTAFDFVVKEDETSVLLYEGAVNLCNNDGECVVVDDYCEVGVADFSDSEILGFTDNISGEDRVSLKSLFPYATDESDLMTIFRIAEARRCLNKPPAPAGGGSPATSTGGGGDGCITVGSAEPETYCPGDAGYDYIKAGGLD